MASIPFIDPGQVLARITTSLSDTTAAIVNDIRSFYAVPDGAQSQGLESNEYRAGMKRRADTISRSQYEVYSFSTKHDLSEAAADELLNMLSNVSDPSSWQRLDIDLICRYSSLSDDIQVAWQVRFRPEDIHHKTLKSMDKAARLAMMPDYEMFMVDLKEGVYY